jgi:hypothetical protein
MGCGHRLAMECARTSGRFGIDCGELIFALVVEQILKTLLQVPAPLERVFEVPSHGTSQRLFGWE